MTLDNIGHLWWVHEGEVLDFDTPPEAYTTYFNAEGEADVAVRANAFGIATTSEYFLDFHGETEIPADVEGCSIRPVLADDTPIRDAGLYGMFGGPLNITDGRYTYFRYPIDVLNQEIYEYTLMPAHQGSLFKLNEFEGAELTRQFGFSKGVPILKLPARNDAERPPVQGGGIEDCDNVLYDLQADPGQTMPIDSPAIEQRLLKHMVELMQENEAPPEAYRRFDLEEYL